MTAATTVLLVRHAAHERVDAVLCGRMPGVHLGAAGRVQADKLAARFAGERIAAVCSSPMERCVETAAPIAARFAMQPRIEDGLNEIAFGAWSGVPFDALAGDPAWQRWNSERGRARTPGGETMAAVQQRATAAVRALATPHADGRIVVVSHADVIKAVLMHLLTMPLDAYDRFDVAPASISTIVLWDGGGKVLGLNERVD